jgi:DNA-binding SARP family transcriptional activator/class 3 adenylate cyclase
VAEQVAELDGLRLLRRFLPATLADTVLAGDDPGLLEPHRAEVAVVVCRLQGFEALTVRAQPEEALEALRGYHEVLGRLVAAHGATTGWIAGGTVQLFFGDPVPHPDPALAAVTLADDLRTEARALVARWAELGHALHVGAGVTFGHATLGTIGFDGRFDYGAVGRVVTDARHLALAAGDGEVLLGRRAQAAVGDRVEVGDDEVVAEGGTVARRVLAVGRAVAPPASGQPVEVDVLGPLVVRHRGEVVELRAARERQVVAVLAAHHGQVVTVERLADEIWDGALAETAVAGLRVHVSRLRKTLGAAGIGSVLQTEGSGYVLRLGDDRAIDATRFAELAADGRARLQTGDPEGAVASLRAALALWRGPVLPDVPAMPSVTALRLRLEEQRLVAIEDRLDAELACGHHRDVLAELEGLLVAHPLRQRFWGQRMLALHRSGRQPEALRAFQALRQVLAEATGLEPAPELRRLEHLVLEQSPELDLPAR